MTHAAIDAARDGTIAWIDDRGDLFICATSPPHDITIIHAHDKEATSVDWSPDGTRVLTAAFDGAVREWNRDGTARRTIIEGLPQAWCARYAPDATAIAVGDGKGVIRIWLDASNEPSFVFETGADRIPQVEFSPDGRLLACAAIHQYCSVLEAATGREMFRLSGHGEFLRAIAFSPDGALIVTGGDDRAVRVWNAASGALLQTIDGLPWSPFDFAFHPSGRGLFVAGRGREILVLDPEAGTELASIELHDRFIFSLAFDPTGSRLYTSGQDPWIGIVDLDHLRSYVRGNWRYGMEQAGRE